MQIDEFNALPEAVARAALDPCLGVPRWVSEVVANRPYGDHAALLAQATASAENLSDDELASALEGHPRIGDRHPSTGDPEEAFSRREQSGVGQDAATAQRLDEGNRRYEQRFDRVFLIRAAGRSTDEILAELDRRLDNDGETERREVVSQLREIALLRLHQVVDG